MSKKITREDILGLLENLRDEIMKLTEDEEEPTVPEWEKRFDEMIESCCCCHFNANMTEREIKDFIREEFKKLCADITDGPYDGFSIITKAKLALKKRGVEL